MDRWRGRAGLAGVLVLTGAITASVAASAPGSGPSSGRPDAMAVVLRTTDGRPLARVPLPASGEFTLRYRNSLYGSLAEERFVATTHGRYRLEQLAADELAVLEEYYGASDPTRAAAGDPRAWVSPPARTVEHAALRVSATVTGRRSLLVPGRAPVALWPLPEDEAIVVLTVEREP